MSHGNPSPASLAVDRSCTGRPGEEGNVPAPVFSRRALPSSLDILQVFALMLCSTALVRRSTNREGLRPSTHKERATSLLVCSTRRPISKTCLSRACRMQRTCPLPIVPQG